ncbi:MAG TPA: 2-phospho-L-lactate guanylyltransferase [Solirubrobacterales bacterium]|nr:2-phospho-L-lactate guanylyltransferase [Solirubrobacterales bacterium]
MKATAVLPVKRFAAAKQRLAPGMGGTHRAELAAAMLADVLEAIEATRSIEQTIVVSSEPRAIELARASDTEVLPDPDQGGHSGAALAGIAHARERGAGCVVLLPIDCPLLATRELERLLTGMPERYVAIVPDRHGTGTNALALAPPDAIEPAFGEGSCARHVAAARAAGIPFDVEELPSLALDLDTPADVVALTMALERDRGRAKRTAKALGI